jgi:hypothetical protein
LKASHHWTDLVFGEHQVAHHHHVARAHVGECHPAPERRSWFDDDTGDSHREIASRKAELQCAVGLRGSRSAQRRLDGRGTSEGRSRGSLRGSGSCDNGGSGGCEQQNARHQVESFLKAIGE